MTAFDDRFKQLTGHEPLCWQKRFYERLLQLNSLPEAVDLPTGLGKTSIIAIWYIAFKAGARLPRRLVYVVDRRAVVDQATEVAERIKERSGDSELRVSTLRGQFVDNRAWLENPAASAIIVGTVDMIGSRLLFSGYGVSPRMRPFHAGLLGADTLVVLDESHLVPPFELLLEQISENGDLGPKAEADRQVIPRFHLLPLSATGRDRDGDVFRLTAEDEEDCIVRQRLTAKKRLTFKPAGDKKLDERLAAEAWNVASESKSPVRVLIYCDSRDVAEKTRRQIEDRAKKQNIGIKTELFVGARRVKEREAAKQSLAHLGFFSFDQPPDQSAFVIATSAGEVGVDLDADHMVCDLVPWERMVQRFGRVNRVGGDDRQARVMLILEPEPEPSKAENEALERKEKGEKLAKKEQERIDAFQARVRSWRIRQEPLRHLPKDENGIDVSPGALRDLKLRGLMDPSVRESIDAAITLPPLYPALTRPLVEAWSMTSLEEHTGRPEVQPWLRGWIEEDEPQTTVVWRKYLPFRARGEQSTVPEINDFFDAAAPHLTEELVTETWRVARWLMARTQAAAKSKRAKANDVVAFTLARDGTLRKSYRLGDLIESYSGKEDKEIERRLDSELAGVTTVVDASLGGLTDGLLDADGEISPVSTADGEDGWLNPETGKPIVPFRVRWKKVEEDKEALADDADANWQPIHAFDAERDPDGQALLQLVVEKWRGEAPDEDARSISSRGQSLQEHQAWTATRAKAVVGALGLEGDLAKAIILAARLHDEGKRAQRWQAAFHTPAEGRPFAKSGSRRPPSFDVLSGYRHEFGSLFHVEKDHEFGALPEDLKDLVLHLVAAHHGRARPVIATEGCDEGPPSVLAARSRDIALRFAGLQKRFGPWGLGWLEALVRAADQQASRDLEEGRNPGG